MKNLYLLVALTAATLHLFAGTETTLTISHQDTTRSFVVHLPTGYQSGEHLPVVFNLHGMGSNAPEQLFYSRMYLTADSNHFIMVVPEGIDNAWNSGLTSPYMGSYPNDVNFISKIIDTIYQLYAVDLTRIYACGMSNGGYMSYRLGCELENRIAAIASVAGTMTDSMAYYCTLQRRVPLLEIHGTADPLVPYGGDAYGWPVEQVIDFWLNSNGCNSVNDTVPVPDVNVNDSSTVEKIYYNNCADSTKVWLYKIAGGGHSWPNAPINYIYGPTNHDMDASQEIWDFFKQFTLNNPVGNVEPGAINPDIKIYPNPVNTMLDIEAGGWIKNILLLNLLGETVCRQKVEAAGLQLNLVDLQPGIYFLTIATNQGNWTGKIIKQ